MSCPSRLSKHSLLSPRSEQLADPAPAHSVFNGITTFPHWTGLHKEPIPTVVLPSDGDLSDLSEEEEPEDEEESYGRSARSAGVDTMGRPVTKRSGSGRRGEISPLLKNVGE